jgi:hypothetical protein
LENITIKQPKLRKEKINDDNTQWNLFTNIKFNCRHCGKPVEKYGFYCKDDKRMSCIDCKDLENNYDHSKLHCRERNKIVEHIHYRVVITPEK